MFHKGGSERFEVPEDLKEIPKRRVTVCWNTRRSDFRNSYQRFGQIGPLRAAACETFRLVKHY